MIAPSLVCEYPDCTVCPDNGMMNYDGDSWWCEHCGTQWNSSGYAIEEKA